MIPTALIAKVCHEVNRAYCESIGDHSQPPWEDAPTWAQDSAIKGVIFTQDNPGARPQDSHESWMAEKLANGWQWGEVKDPQAKTHPCLVEYSELPKEQQAKDRLFQDTVRALS
mgnify:CR=1 FL=1